MKKILLFGLMTLASNWASAQDQFARFEFLIGNWQGVETGMPGDGIGFRNYRFELNRNYIFVDNTSVFPISTEYPRGEVHRDFTVFSFNANIDSVVLRQFHVEGFTNIYQLDEALSTEDKAVFLSREIENNPGDWKARLTLTRVSDDEFKEEFEVAMDGQTYSPIVSNEWQRVN